LPIVGLLGAGVESNADHPILRAASVSAGSVLNGDAPVRKPLQRDLPGVLERPGLELGPCTFREEKLGPDRGELRLEAELMVRHPQLPVRESGRVEPSVLVPNPVLTGVRLQRTLQLHARKVAWNFQTVAPRFVKGRDYPQEHAFIVRLLGFDDFRRDYIWGNYGTRRPVVILIRTGRSKRQHCEGCSQCGGRDRLRPAFETPWD